MEAFIIMLRNVLVFVALAIPGYLLVKTKTLSQEQSGVLSKILMYVGVPFLIVSTTLNVDFNANTVGMILFAAGFTVAFTFLMFFLSYFFTKGEKEEKTRGILRFSAVFSNNGFLGIPLAQAVFGLDSMATALVVVINIVSNMLLFTLGVYLVSGDKKTISVKSVLLNPVLIGFAVGIVLNLTGVKNYVAETVTYTGYISAIVTPISMFILGMKLGSVPLVNILRSPKMYYASFWKLLVMPCLAVLALFALRLAIPQIIGTAMMFACFVGLGTPTAGSSSIFTDMYDGDTDNAVIFTLGTTLLSIITIPLLYWGLTALL